MYPYLVCMDNGKCVIVRAKDSREAFKKSRIKCPGAEPLGFGQPKLGAFRNEKKAGAREETGVVG